VAEAQRGYHGKVPHSIAHTWADREKRTIKGRFNMKGCWLDVRSCVSAWLSRLEALCTEACPLHDRPL